MRYRTGEVAEFFGMTKEGVRFLERQGVIRSERDETNGYRYFSRREITKLKQIRSYQALGFSLEEAERMVCHTRREEMLERIDEKLHDLEEKEEQLRRMKGMLLSQRQAAQSVLEGKEDIGLTMRPELILFPAVKEQASGATLEEREQIALARQAEKAWIQAMPPVMLGAIHCDAEGKAIPGLFGSVASVKLVEALGLPVLPCMIHLPSCLCVRYVKEAPQAQMAELAPMFDWARKNGYTPYGEVYATMQATYCDDEGNTRRIHTFYLPVYEKKITGTP